MTKSEMTIDESAEFGSDVPATLAYATPAARSGSPTVAAGIISFLGLGLIVVGGCFLIGVLLCSQNVGSANSFGIPFSVAVLYLLAFCCFAGAVWLLLIGIRRLILIARG